MYQQEFLIMKVKVIAGLALAVATVLTSPAFAQSGRAVNQYGAAYDAYAQAYGPWDQNVRRRQEHLGHRNWDVYDTNGVYVGRDPDPNVRDMIARDREEQLGTGF
jgi:hypothetical protein